MIESSQLIHNQLLLYEDSIRPVRFWLEELSPDQPVQRKESSLWEELFCIAGLLSVNGLTFPDGYFCLPPGERISHMKPAGGKATLLRVATRPIPPRKVSQRLMENLRSIKNGSGTKYPRGGRTTLAGEWRSFFEMRVAPESPV